MIPIFNSSTDSNLDLDSALCYYSNSTSRIQTIRITNIPNLRFERIIFPQQRLLFSAPPTAQLEIYPGGQINPSSAMQLSCKQLQVRNAKTAAPEPEICLV